MLNVWWRNVPSTHTASLQLRTSNIRTNNVNNSKKIRKTDSVRAQSIQNPSIYTLSHLVGSERKVGRKRLSHWLAECCRCNKGSKFRKGFLPFERRSTGHHPCIHPLDISLSLYLASTAACYSKSFLFKEKPSEPLLFATLTLSLGGYYRILLLSFLENYKN